MKTAFIFRLLGVGALVMIGCQLPAATVFVWQNSPNPAAPYTNWDTAAHVIQDAVDAAQVGDTVLVTNGIYASGGRAVYGSMTNRLTVDKPLVVQSVNGPESTVIQGRQVPGTTNGDGAIRCAYLTNGAVLSGFTLTNGATRTDGDFSREKSGGGLWCESTNAVATNCVLTSNSANYGGGGVSGGTLYNCTLIHNSASLYGGGAYYGTLDNCTLNDNSAVTAGGGASSAILNKCTLSGNSAFSGGGASSGTLNNCRLTANLATGTNGSGGGANSGILNNCKLTSNLATGVNASGGGASSATLNNCTLTGNLASYCGGGAYNAVLNNCILYYNKALAGGQNLCSSTARYCCATPLPPEGVGNIELEPQLASDSHLSAGSPCRGAGSPAYATGTDIEGEDWRSPPSIGCDEYWDGSVTGPLSVDLAADWTTVAPGYALDFRAVIGGRTVASAWDFGDGLVVSNRPYVSHVWVMPGTYQLVLRAWNESNPTGVTAMVTVEVRETVHYAAAGSASPSWPYGSWATAATNIQDAVDAAPPGALVLVSNGVYAAGGRAVHGVMTNRVAVNKQVVVLSVNGPEFTVIQGRQVPGTTNGDEAMRCVYLTNGAVLSGFTLTQGATRRTGDADKEQSGGGVWCESSSALVSNCVVTGNSACAYGCGAYSGTLNNCTLSGNSGSHGGGAYNGTLNNCTLNLNLAYGNGGGAYNGTLNNCNLTHNLALGVGGGAYNVSLTACTLTDNSAFNGGGVYSGTLNNCTLSGNSASNRGGGVYYCTLSNCILSSNSATSGGGVTQSTLDNCTLAGNSASNLGGGASSGTFNNCKLIGNWASNGGGTFGGVLNNCTIIGNSARIEGGGTSYGTLQNCILYFNSAPSGTNYQSDINLYYCCTTPLPGNGAGNITNEPLFMDRSNGNLRLQSNSPCINAGCNLYATGATDLDGLPRIAGGTVDMGAYEFQSPASVISYAWLQRYSLSTDGSADAADFDLDGFNNWQEWQADTDPTNGLSLFRIAAISNGPPLAVYFQSSTNRLYTLSYCTNLADIGTQVWTPIAGQALIRGSGGLNALSDTNVVPPRFYRVQVQVP